MMWAMSITSIGLIDCPVTQFFTTREAAEMAGLASGHDYMVWEFEPILTQENLS